MGCKGVALMSNIWIYKVECDFCGAEEGIWHVDISGEPEFYTACMKCIIEKGWRD
jgi:hypothetical protein